MPIAVQKNWIRGQKLEVFIPAADGVSALVAFQRAGEAGRVIASNARMSKALVGTNEWESIRPVFTCLTGTMTAYAEPGTPLNKSEMFSRNDGALVYADPKTGKKWIFLLSEVPEKSLSVPNVLLAAEHPDYSIEVVGGAVVVKPGVVDTLFNFPAEDGSHLGDPKHDLPVGDKADCDCNLNARYLWRIGNAGRVGFAVRDLFTNDDGVCGHKYVYLCHAPSDAFGIAVESP